MEEPKLGMTYSFVPTAFIGEHGNPPGPGGTRAPSRVNGRVTYINRPHRWFQVPYEVHGNQLKECFKF
ncbi:MAG: hypothetical protein IKB79_04840 [Oscillospiraceae bacterium]|nr:hypothetical protein [Oscillospiraceae bacterium]